MIAETGLCAWRSGQRPVLDIETGGEFLRGRLALFWTGVAHDMPAMVSGERDYDAIARAGATARQAVWSNDLALLAAAVPQSFAVQRNEGMAALPGDLPGALAWKYCGGGFGGYAVYLFTERAQRDTACTHPGFRPIEPFVATR